MRVLEFDLTDDIDDILERAGRWMDGWMDRLMNE